jgi:DNA-binding transcriptional ArsR family regulator
MAGNMSTLLEKPIKINRVMTISVDQARALEDPARARVVEILYHKQLTTELIAKELQKNGYNKALTTIRHHLEILKEAGLIEIVKIEEIRGAIAKFYGTSIKLIPNTSTKDFDTKYSPMIKSTSAKIEKILDGIAKKPALQKKSESLHNEFILMEIVNRAIANVLENKNFAAQKKIK